MARKTIEWGKDNWNGDALVVYQEDDGTYTFWRQGNGEKKGLTKDAALKMYKDSANGPRYNSANSARNAKVKVGDKIKIVADTGAWRKGEKGTVIGGDYLPGYFFVKFDGGTEGRIPEEKMAVANSRARNAKFKVGDHVRTINPKDAAYNDGIVQEVVPQKNGKTYYLVEWGDGIYDDYEESKLIPNSAPCASTNEVVTNAINSRAAKNDADPYLSEKLKLMIRHGAISEAAGGKPMPGDVVFEYRGKRYYTDKDSAHMVKQFSDAGLVKMHNSRAANAKFKVGDRVKWLGKTEKITGIRTEPDGQYYVFKTPKGVDFAVHEDDIISANSRARNAEDKIAKVSKMVGRKLTPSEIRSAKILIEAGEPLNRIARSIQAMAPNSRAANCGVRSTIPAVNAALGAAAANALPKVGDRVRRAYGGGKEIGKVESVDVDRGIWSVRFPSGVAHTGPHLLEVVKARY